MKLYFSHEIGDCLAFRGKEGHAKALLTNPMAEYIVTDNDAVWFNRGKDRVVIDEIDEKYKILAIRNRRLVPKIRGKYRFHLVGVESPTEIWNLKPDSAEIMPNTEFYVLPNGRAYYHGIKVQSWTRKWGKDKLEFNRRSFLEAKRMAEDGEYTAKKPKGKKKNKFFDPKVVEGLKESKKSNLPGILATKDKSIVASGMNLCDDCRYNTVCPGFAAGSVCKYSETFKYLIPKIKSREKADQLGLRGSL
jgi:hypothetical protein